MIIHPIHAYLGRDEGGRSLAAYVRKAAQAEEQGGSPIVHFLSFGLRHV
jgi:hypothetical protein